MVHSSLLVSVLGRYVHGLVDRCALLDGCPQVVGTGLREGPEGLF